MTRTKGGYKPHLRHKKIIHMGKGQFGSRHRLFKRANEAMLKSLWYAYRDRRNRKRDLRKLWIVRINAAARLHEMSYSQLVAGLKAAGCDLDRKLLADMAVRDAEGFGEIVKLAKKGLASRTAAA